MLSCKKKSYLTNFSGMSGTIQKSKRIVYLICMKSYRCVVSNERKTRLLEFCKAIYDFFFIGRPIYNKMLGGLINYFLPTSMGFLEQSKSTKIMYLIYLENLGCVFPMNKIARLLEFCRGSYHVFPICCPREKNVGGLKIYFWTNFRGNSRTRQK